MIRLWPAAVVAAAFLTASCKPETQGEKPQPPRPVRTVTVGAAPQVPPVVFPGRIEAKDIADLGFRIPGRLAERRVAVGDTVRAGDVLARLDDEVELNDLRSARAALVAAESSQRQADARLERHKHLYERGITSRADLDAAELAAKAAGSQVEAAGAKVRIAEDVVGFTILKADGEGVVTATGAEPGEVVVAGRPVVRVARRDARDAVLDVPAATLDLLSSDTRVTVALPGDPAATATGRVREVTPEADPVTRLFRVRIGLANAPPGLRLGSSVQVAISPAEASGFVVPASALLREGGAAAVWVVDPATGRVSRRAVELAQDDPALAVVSKGLAAGDVVVTAGVSTLAPGLTVRLAGVER